MKRIFAVSVLALGLGVASGTLAASAHASAVPAQPQYQGQGRWDEAPSEYRDVQRQGFHDGMEAARRDYDHHSRKDADDHDEYRHPRVERGLVGDYRSAFKEGYSRAKQHLRDDHDRDDRR